MLLSYIKGGASPVPLLLLGAWDMTQSPLQGVHMWAPGKPTHTLLQDPSPPGLWGGCGDRPAVGTILEDFIP